MKTNEIVEMFKTKNQQQDFTGTFLDTDVLKRAITTYGKEEQMMMMVEEASELIQAINKVRRAKNDAEEIEAMEHLAEEVADCFIVLMQMKLMVCKKRVDEILNYKMNRLKRNLDKQEVKNVK